MPKFLDLTGQKFGQLRVVGRIMPCLVRNPRRVYWLCRCDCGRLVDVRSDSLLLGKTVTCGLPYRHWYWQHSSATGGYCRACSGKQN